MSSWDGTVNARDLGGLPLQGGGTTASGVLLRSDALQALTPSGQAQLAASPVTAIVDFRTDVERLIAPDLLPADRAFHQEHLPLLEGALSGIVEEALSAHSAGDLSAAGEAAARAMANLPTLAQMYTGMLAHGAPAFAEVARLVAESDGGVLIHCTAGKDRTGVCAAVLLDAVGVEREAIVADYALTQDNLRGPWFDRMTAMVTAMGIPVTPALAELIAGSPPEAISAALAWVDEQGGAAAYLRSGGATDEVLAAMRARLTAPAATA